jgi:hypothetical protein
VTPEKSLWPGEGRLPRPKPRKEWLVARMLQFYDQLCLMAVNDAAKRTQEGLRMRADGSPSAVPPQATLPVDLWATVQDAPDGGEYSPPDRLRAYQEWLKKLQANGLYDGPTELTRVNDD